MKKVAVNTIIDAFSFLLFSCLVSTGILIAFRLPPGSGQLNILGLTRHQWGDLHLALAIAFIALVIAHLYLHRTWITSIFRRDNKTIIRAGMFTILVLLPAVLIAMPIAVPTESYSDVPAERHCDRSAHSNQHFRKHKGL